MCRRVAQVKVAQSIDARWSACTSQPLLSPRVLEMQRPRENRETVGNFHRENGRQNPQPPCSRSWSRRVGGGAAPISPLSPNAACLQYGSILHFGSVKISHLKVSAVPSFAWNLDLRPLAVQGSQSRLLKRGKAFPLSLYTRCCQVLGAEGATHVCNGHQVPYNLYMIHCNPPRPTCTHCCLWWSGCSNREKTRDGAEWSGACGRLSHFASCESLRIPSCFVRFPTAITAAA